MSQGYGAHGHGAHGYGSQGYSSRGYASPGYTSQGYTSQGYSGEGYSSQGYPAQGYTSPGHVAQGSSQGYGTQGYGTQGYGTQGYGMEGYGTQGYRAQGYPGQGYGAPGTASPAYPAQGPSQGQGGQDYGPPGAAESAAAPATGAAGLSTDAGPAAPGSTAPGSMMPGPAAPGSAPPESFAGGSPGQEFLAPGSAVPGPAAPGAADYPARTSSAPVPAAGTSPAPASAASGVEPSAEPLYRVLGGLALRDLTLVESLLQLVEQLESREEDPQQLDSLFRIDHLATRMRRNSENLLVLAGQDREGQDFEPVPLLDVARAAVSEITDYNRAQVAPLPGVRLLGVAADDVSHILAELLDNATSKSPESAPVVIRADRTGDGTLVVSVEDSGIGIPLDRLNEINARLSRLPVIDVAVTRHMGLYVVGRLAHRHGIRVQLRERPYGGIVASVIIPSQLVRNDPDAAPGTHPEESAGRYQPLSGWAPLTPRLGIEGPGSGGLHRQGAHPGTQYSRAHEAAGEAGKRPGAGDPSAAQPGAPTSADQPASGDGPASGQPGSWQPASASSEEPLSGVQWADAGQTAPAPAAGYADAVPTPRFEPADPAELPKRKPGALSAVNGIPAPPIREKAAPVPPEDPVEEDIAGESEADRIRSELSGFQLGQRAARHEASRPAGGAPDPVHPPDQAGAASTPAYSSPVPPPGAFGAPHGVPGSSPGRDALTGDALTDTGEPAGGEPEENDQA